MKKAMNINVLMSFFHIAEGCGTALDLTKCAVHEH